MNEDIGKQRIGSSIVDTLNQIREKLLSSGREDAAKKLLPVEQEKHFFLQNGETVKSLYELVYVLRDMDEGQFAFHANESKHDFANWIRHVISDHHLANSIEGDTNKHSVALKVAKRYTELHQKVHR